MARNIIHPRSLIASTIVGGILLFAWGTISWMYLPWHHLTFSKFTDEAVVSAVIKSNAPHQGVYHLPSREGKTKEQLHEQFKQGPLVLAAVQPTGFEGMTTHLAFGFLINLLAALIISLIISLASTTVFAQRVLLGTLIGLAVGALAHLPAWNWFGFPTLYTLVKIADVTIGTTIVGAVAAVLTSRGK